MITDRSSKASSFPACSRRQFVSFSAMLGLAPLTASVAPRRAGARQGDVDGIVDPLGVLYTSLLHFAPFDAKMRDGVRVVFDPALLGESGLVSADALPLLPGSFQALLAVQSLATLPEDPAVYTANFNTKVFVFGSSDDAKSWINVINGPWLTGSATVYDEEQAGVRGHTLGSYESADVYQPNLTNMTWFGSFRHGAFVWQQTHSSVLPELATGSGLDPVVAIAADAKRAFRNTLVAPLADEILVPADSRELLFVPSRSGGGVLSLLSDTDDSLERRTIFTDGAIRAGSIQYNGIATDGSNLFINQNVLEFGDDGAAADAFSSMQDRFIVLDSMTGSNRLFLVEKVDDALLAGADDALIDIFDFDAGGSRFGGTELIRRSSNRLHTRAVVTPRPLENSDLTSYRGSDQFAREMQRHMELADEYRRLREDEEAADKFLWIAALTGFSAG